MMWSKAEICIAVDMTVAFAMAFAPLAAASADPLEADAYSEYTDVPS